MAQQTIFYNTTSYLHKVVFGMDKIAGHLLETKLNLTFSQFRILLVIDRTKGACQADVAKYHNLTSAAISRQIELLQKNKLLVTKQNPKNRRENILALTPLGLSKLQKGLKLVNGKFEGFYKILTLEEQKILAGALEKLNKTICG